MTAPAIIRSPELARRLGISEKTLWDMRQRNPELASCIIDNGHSRPWWSVKRLIEKDFLVNDLPSNLPAAELRFAD